MINGLHALIYTKHAEQVRAFFRDVLGAPHVDGGAGWPIFALPPAEVGIHPENDEWHELFLMCDDIDRTLAELKTKGIVAAEPIADERWGRVTKIRIADGVTMSLYEPRHPTALQLTTTGTRA